MIIYALIASPQSFNWKRFLKQIQVLSDIGSKGVSNTHPTLYNVFLKIFKRCDALFKML